jgi:hypothetical protein
MNEKGNILKITEVRYSELKFELDHKRVELE